MSRFGKYKICLSSHMLVALSFSKIACINGTNNRENVGGRLWSQSLKSSAN
eukprot:SAG31_NODE_1415_length_8443_cov_6.910986_6_plen_51_part_00